MLHDLDQKNLHINEQFFLQNPKNPFFGVIFGHYPQTQIFAQKIRLYQLLTLRQPNFMRSFKKTL